MSTRDDPPLWETWARRAAQLLVIVALAASCSDDAPAGDSTAVASTLAPLVNTTTPGVPPAAETSNAAPTAASAPTSAVAATTPASTTTTTSTTLPPTTTTTILTEGAVVLVANATDVPGAAGQLSEQLRARAFTVAEPTNAAGNEELLDVSKVYFLPAGEAVARSVALLMGLTAAPLPVPAPIVGATAELGDATVLVMVGADLAGKPFPST